MIGRLFLYVSLLLSISIVVVAACSAPQVAPPTVSPSATPESSASRTGSPAPSGSPGPSPSPSAGPTAGPVSCPVQTGGSSTAQAQLVAVRVAPQAGFDRVVFEFGPSTAPGTSGMPAYTVEQTTGFRGTSGLAVPVDGNVFLGVRFQNTSTRNPDGTASYIGPSTIEARLALVRQAKMIEDFERVMVWGLGLERTACARVSELSGPTRLVLDLPTT